MSMKKLTLGFGLALLCVSVVSIVGSTAVAGYKSTQGVSINFTSRNATASIGGTRNSANTTESVDLVYSATSTGTESVWIFMCDAAGQTASCTSMVPAILNAAQSISSDSYILIAWDTAGKCTTLQVGMTSYLPPKAP